jgi:hypothetical protein
MKKLILAILLFCSLSSILEKNVYAVKYYGNIKFVGSVFYGKIYGDIWGTPPAYNVVGTITYATKSLIPNLFGIMSDLALCTFDFNETDITGRYEEGKITAAITFQIAVDDSYKYSAKRDLIDNRLDVSCYGIVETSIITFGVTDIYIDKDKK